mgnify:CR=1 FL=1
MPIYHNSSTDEPVSMATEVPSDPPEYCSSCGKQIMYLARIGGKLARLGCPCRNLESFARSSSDPNIRRLFGR